MNRFLLFLPLLFAPAGACEPIVADIIEAQADGVGGTTSDGSEDSASSGRRFPEEVINWNRDPTADPYSCDFVQLEGEGTHGTEPITGKTVTPYWVDEANHPYAAVCRVNGLGCLTLLWGWPKTIPGVLTRDEATGISEGDFYAVCTQLCFVDADCPLSQYPNTKARCETKAPEYPGYGTCSLDCETDAACPDGWHCITAGNRVKHCFQSLYMSMSGRHGIP